MSRQTDAADSKPSIWGSAGMTVALNQIAETLQSVTKLSIRVSDDGFCSTSERQILIPSLRLSPGTNAYEMAGEVASLLSLLMSSGTPVIFTGPFAEHQAIFGTGQGSLHDPMHPVIQHAPVIPLEELARFAVLSAGRRVGGLPVAAETRITREVVDDLKDQPQDMARRLLQPAASHSVQAWKQGKSSNSVFVGLASRRQETFGGLNVKAPVLHSSELRNRLVEAVSAAGFPEIFQRNLVGQDSALNHLVAHLRKEALLRPAHQPGLPRFRMAVPGPGLSHSSSAADATFCRPRM